MKKILVVLDNTAADDAVVARLRELCSDSTSAQLLAIVHQPALDGYLGNTEIYAPLRQRLIDEEADKIEKIAHRLRDRGVNVVAKAIWDWPRDDAIRREAEAFGADFIILSFGIGPERHLGSRDWRFLAECPLPILVVNAAADKPLRNIIAAVDPVHAHAKPANLDQAIVRLAKSVCERAAAQLELIHCFLPLAHYHVGTDDIDRLPLNDAEQALEKSRQQALELLAKEAGLEPGQTRLIEGEAEQVLAAFVEWGQADLIVMGALARGKLADFVIGSTAERVLRKADCDILLVKPAGSRQ
jgi:universal stress protein E